MRINEGFHAFQSWPCFQKNSYLSTILVTRITASVGATAGPVVAQHRLDSWASGLRIGSALTSVDDPAADIRIAFCCRFVLDKAFPRLAFDLE